MRLVGARWRAFVLATSLAALVAGAVVPAATAAKAPPGLDRFMRAVGSIESGGRYDARNPVSGAYGKYQILPSNWRAWARQYLGDANARPTARNQERVARAKFSGLHRWLDSWRQVAYWWLTGDDGRDGRWSSSARRYVDKVMTRYARSGGGGGGGGGGAAKATTKTFSESSKAVAYTGSWASARHHGYQGGKVRYATDAGATVTFTFTGSSVAWLGPEGPTRGKARISVDGTVVKTVDLRSSGFRPKATVWSKRWASGGEHTVTIEVLGTRGRPYVAVDAFLVKP